MDSTRPGPWLELGGIERASNLSFPVIDRENPNGEGAREHGPLAERAEVELKNLFVARI